MSNKTEMALLGAVATVSAYHVIVQFSAADHIAVAAVQGLSLSALLAYFAHGVATKRGWQKAPALVGLLLFAVFSATFQTIHFLRHDASTWEAIARGCWAPVAEVLLGLMLVNTAQEARNLSARGSARASKLGLLGGAIMDRAIAQVSAPEASKVAQNAQIEQAPQEESAPTLRDANMSRAKRIDARRAELDAQLRNQGSLTTSEIAQLLSVSPNTVRADLEAIGAYKNGDGAWHASQKG